MNAPLLQVRGLRVAFGRAPAVDGVTFAVPEGSTLAIIGESGAGKTMLARTIMGLLPASAAVDGSVLFHGHELLTLGDRQMRRRRGRDLAMVFQDPARSLNPTMQIGAQVAEAVRIHQPVDRRAARERAVELLDLVRIPQPRQRFRDYPHQLSGGMRQRVLIAIAIACHPKLLIADEATTALDATTQAQIMELLLRLQHELRMTLVLVSHDLALAASYADDIMVMYAGRIMEHAPYRDLLTHPRTPYTRLLLDAIPRLENPPHTLLPSVPGHAGSAPEGCPFAPRCPSARGSCRETVPPLQEHGRAHRWACWHPNEEGVRP